MFRFIEQTKWVIINDLTRYVWSVSHQYIAALLKYLQTMFNMKAID